MKKKMGSVLGWAARILPQSTSGGKGLGAERRSESEVERRVVEALRRRREEEEASGKKRIVHFNTLVMKFAKSDEAFKQIRKQFDQYDKDASQSIDLHELRTCLAALGVRIEEEVMQLYREADMDGLLLSSPPSPQQTRTPANQSIDLEELRTYKDASQSIDLEELRTCLSALGVQIEEEEVMQLYREADMDCCDGVHFKEFILLLALLYLLQPNAHFGTPEVEDAFGLIADAFNFFDTTGEGFLTQAKVQAAMTTGRDSSPSRIAGQRFGKKRGWGPGAKVQTKVQAAMSSGRDSSPSRIAGQRFGNSFLAQAKVQHTMSSGQHSSPGQRRVSAGDGVAKMDYNPDGQCTFSRFLPISVSLAILRTHAPSGMDYNTDGQCTFKEFLFAHSSPSFCLPCSLTSLRTFAPDSPAEMDQLFTSWVDGFTLTHSHPPPDPPAAEMDYNTDGQCTFKEFLFASEMDYNTDGQCTFKEFLFAYVGWVGTAEEEEDEEEEEKEEERSKTPKTPKTPKSPSKSPKSPKSPRTPRHSGGHR
ncbi:unnamed protein product [Closterium sp. NIES-64]|nr:unnamed protein product [Closterium sp. NIES-64]